MTITITIANPDDLFDADARAMGEPTPGPWVRVRSDDPACDYKVAVLAEDGAEALGRRIFALVGEALKPIGVSDGPIEEATDTPTDPDAGPLPEVFRGTWLEDGPMTRAPYTEKGT